MIEAQKQFEKMVGSSCPQNFQISCSFFPERLKGKSLWEKTMEFVQETERIMQSTIDLPCPPNVHTTHESCHFGNPASILSYQPELDQHRPLDSLASYSFPEIELEVECEPELQVNDSSPFIESISTPVVLPELSNVLEPVLIPIISKLESFISPIHIPSGDENQDSI